MTTPGLPGENRESSGTPKTSRRGADRAGARTSSHPAAGRAAASARPAVPAAGSRAARRARIATRGSARSRSWTCSQIGEESVVADLGAGGGWFTIRLARRAVERPVYAEDIQREMIEAINRRVEREGPRPTSARSSARLPIPTLPEPVDAVLIVDAYHEMDDPVVLLRNVAKSLKPRRSARHRGLHEGWRRPGPADGRTRRSRTRHPRRAVCGPAAALAPQLPSLPVPASSSFASDAGSR